MVLARAAWFSADPERKGAFSARDAPRVQDARAALAANASHVREEAQSMKPSRLSIVAIAALGKVALADPGDMWAPLAAELARDRRAR